ncbi:MAG: outer membrane protein transport protein, partial [FCB group bacterium]|nr:outer membrane protein transport protein [FCB group bacterium]
MLRRAIFTVLVCVWTGWAVEAAAGALNRIGGIGPRAGAMGGAYTAIADDASLFYYNPAGMSRFDSPYAETGTDILFPIFHYDSPTRGSADSKSGVFHVLPLMGYVHPLNDSVTAGVGVYVPYGIGADFEHNPQALNFHTKTLTCLTHVSPGLALKLNDELSLGLTLNIGYAQFRCKTPFDIAGHYLPLPTDSWGDGFGVGAGFGVLWAGDKVSLGAAYSTGTHADIDGATGMGAGLLRIRDGFSSSIDFPERASAGIAIRPVDRLEISFDTSWYGYTGAMDDLTLDFDTIPMKKTQTFDWEDNYALHT